MNLPLNTSIDIHDPVEQARYNMVEQQIRPWNVLDAGGLELLSRVRREDFVPPSYQGLAFIDTEIPLNPDAQEAARLGQVILAPRVDARMLQDLQIQPTDRVLEIGAGSGYMAALLAACAERVVTLEIDPDLAEFARENLRALKRPQRGAEYVHANAAWFAGMGEKSAILLKGLGTQFALGGTDALETPALWAVPEIESAGGLNALRVLGRPAQVMQDAKMRLFGV